MPLSDTPITGKTLIALGHAPAAWFKAAIADAEAVRRAGGDAAAIAAAISRHVPAPVVTRPMRPPGALSFTLNIHADDPDDAANIAAVEAHMGEIMRVPTLVAGAVMPDACASGASARHHPRRRRGRRAQGAIHPGMHSADICCSMAVRCSATSTRAAVLDAGMAAHPLRRRRPALQPDMQPSGRSARGSSRPTASWRR